MAVTFVAPWSAAAADDAAKKKKTATAKSEKADGSARQRAKPRGRLPNFYAQVVDDTQREKIYQIQQGYKAETAKLEAKIRDLRKQMKALKQRQAESTAAVLSAKQRTEVDRLRAAAKQRRAQARKDE